MKPSDVEVPFYLARLPKDHRGWPITYTSLQLPNGVVDFTTTNPIKWRECATGRACALCGIVLKRRIWFIGGPLCHHNRLFFDLAMHEECARYSLLICPYLSMPKYLGAKSRPMPDELRVEIMSSNSTKPRCFMLGRTDGYQLVQFQGDILVRANRWQVTEWWQDGKQIKGPVK